MSLVEILLLAFGLFQAIIGSVTFALCLAGVRIGNVSGHFFEKKIEIAGGLVLIGIGLKILIQHSSSHYGRNGWCFP